RNFTKQQSAGLKPVVQCRSSKDCRQIESKAVDAHVHSPVSQGVLDQLANDFAGCIEIIATAGAVPVICISSGQHVVFGIVEASHAEDLRGIGGVTPQTSFARVI